MDKQELASFLGISRYTVDAWVSQKRIPFIKIGGKLVKFDMNDVNQWLEQQKVCPKPE